MDNQIKVHVYVTGLNSDGSPIYYFDSLICGAGLPLGWVKIEEINYDPPISNEEIKSKFYAVDYKSPEQEIAELKAELAKYKNGENKDAK